MRADDQDRNCIAVMATGTANAQYKARRHASTEKGASH
jgi:hypothetical protein